jgi:hypothetical protein
VAHEITCPACKARLQIAADAEGPWLTCPRCLAINTRSAIEQTAITSEPRTETSVTASPSSQVSWADVTGRPVGQIRSADYDVRRDSSATYWGILALPGLFGLAALLGWLAGKSNSEICCFGGYPLLVLLSFPLLHRAASKAGRGLLGGFLVVVCLGALFIVFFVTCAAS